MEKDNFYYVWSVNRVILIRTLSNFIIYIVKYQNVYPEF